MGKLHTRRTEEEEEEETKLPLERIWTKISTEAAHEITPPGLKPPDFCNGKARKGVSFFSCRVWGSWFGGVCVGIYTSAPLIFFPPGEMGRTVLE
jgi:hypothetical protein